LELREDNTMSVDAVAAPITAAAPTTPAEKTKAKQRYLRKKKERRKHRKVAAPQSARPKSALGAPIHSAENEIADTTQTDDHEADWEDERMDEDKNKDVSSHSAEKQQDEDMDEEELEQARRKAEKKRKREERPKKRRKVAEVEEEEQPDSGLVDDPEPSLKPQPTPTSEADLDISEPPPPLTPAPQPHTRRSPTPVGFLPSFPIPAQPAPPSKLALALQGLDTALQDAEVLDASSTLPLSTAADASRVGLSEGMRKRLLELGISELFAGKILQTFSIRLLLILFSVVQTALLPFLLPADLSQRALYMPYNPPRDACVSAPTGSGKTLAYVLPIIEVQTLSPLYTPQLFKIC
jgi:ATP-dependent RNA helicase DDX51/DBP6